MLMRATNEKSRSKPPHRPRYPKETYVGGKDENRDVSCDPNVNNPSR